MEKVIKLTGRIDTTNASLVEENINKELENFDGDIILDVDTLEYISSAGLRIIMRLKKRFNNTKIINCNLEIYEIFQMTGFTQMMEITKKLREISLEGCKVIGTGFYGDVYRIDSETIVKLYKKGVPIETIQREINLAQKAFVLGVPTAIPYDIVKVGDLLGAVFELINAKSLQEIIIDGGDIDKLIYQTTDILKHIHSTKVEKGELPSRREQKIEQAKYISKLLPEEAANKLINLFEKLPETNTMIHGDFQIKNIMKQNDELILIDMNTISVGHPIIELGAMYAAYIGFSAVDKNNSKEFLGIDLDDSTHIFNTTMRYYFENKSEEFIEKIIEKAKIIAYLQILCLRYDHGDKDNPVHQKDIEHAIEYISTNVGKIDTLEF